MATYSFNDVQVSISGPGGAFIIGGPGSGAAPDESITSEMNEDKNVMTIGSSGDAMHSLSANNSGTMTVRLLKTSPVNRLLNQLYNFQKGGLSANWGQNVIRITDMARGDIIVGRTVAFKKHTPVKYGKEGGTNEWAFDAGIVDNLLGAGVPDVNVPV